MRIWQMALTKNDLVGACDGTRAVTTWRKRWADRKAAPLIIVVGPLGLSFRSADGTLDVAARGDWPSPIRVAGAVLHAIAPLHSGPEVTIVYANEQLVIGTTVLTEAELYARRWSIRIGFNHGAFPNPRDGAGRRLERSAPGGSHND